MLNRRQIVAGISLLPIVSEAETYSSICAKVSGFNPLESAIQFPLATSSVVLVSNFISCGVGLGNLLVRGQSGVYLRNFFAGHGGAPAYRFEDGRIHIKEGFVSSHSFSLEERFEAIRRSNGLRYVANISARCTGDNGEVLQQLKDLGFKIVFISLSDQNLQRVNYILSQTLQTWASRDGRPVTGSVPSISEQEMLAMGNRFIKWNEHFEKMLPKYADASLVFHEHEVFFGKALENVAGGLFQSDAFIKDPVFSESLKRPIYEALAKAGIPSYA